MNPIYGRGRRGTMLAVTLVLMAVAAFGSLIMARTVLEQGRLNNRRRELARALYAAEAGVALVQHWSNFPADYTPNTSLFARGTSTPTFPALRTALGAGGFTITSATLQTLGERTFSSGHGYNVSYIDRIEILPHESGDPVGCLVKIRATGKSALVGVRRTVTAYGNASQMLSVEIPAALISHDTASAHGNARIHWGEAWSKNQFTMLNESQMGYLDPGSSDYDRWVKYRSEGTMSWPNNWKWGSGKDLYDASRVQPGQAPASGEYANAFYHHLPSGTLNWITLDYQTYKDMALARGRYYSTDASGNVYRDGVEDSAHRVDFLTEFGVSNRDSSPYDLAFIDTVNSLPPAADGSNLATISVSGNSLGMKGVFWVGANFGAGGVGNPPALGSATDPDGHTHSLDKILLDGVLYSAGTVELSGNAGIYGSVVAQRGFAGGGTPDIYYNAGLANGLDVGNGNVGSNIAIALYKNY